MWQSHPLCLTPIAPVKIVIRRMSVSFGEMEMVEQGVKRVLKVGLRGNLQNAGTFQPSTRTASVIA